jgi:hypothetical protein
MVWMRWAIVSTVQSAKTRRMTRWTMASVLTAHPKHTINSQPSTSASRRPYDHNNNLRSHCTYSSYQVYDIAR